MLCEVSYFDLSDPLYVWTGFQIHLNTTLLHLSLRCYTQLQISPCNGETKCYTVNIFLQTHFRYKTVNLILIFLFNTHKQLVINHSNKKKLPSLPCERLVNLIN